MNGAFLARFIHDGERHVAADDDLFAAWRWPEGWRCGIRSRPSWLASRKDCWPPCATPPMWKVRIVNWVPGSPMDCAAMMPTASPMVDQRAAGQVTAIAHGANAFLGLAGQRAADAGHGDVGLTLDQVSAAFVDQLATADDDLGGAGDADVIRGHPAQHAFGQGLHDFTVVDGGFGRDRAVRCRNHACARCSPAPRPPDGGSDSPSSRSSARCRPDPYGRRGWS